MIVFSSDPAKEAELFDAKDWITQALSAQQLIVSKHEGDPKKSHSRSAQLLIPCLDQKWGSAMSYS